MWANPDFLDELYKDTVAKQPKVYNSSWKEEIKNQFKQSLGEFASLEAFNPELIDEQSFDTYVRYSFEITTLPKLRMQFYLLLPKNHVKPMPVVLALHGHGYGNKAAVGLNPDGTERKGKTEYHKDFAIQLVEKGVVVAVPELIGFGDRRFSKETPKNEADNTCYSLAKQLLIIGKTLAGLRIFECQRLIDYLAELDYVDTTRLGCMGISGGGLVAGFLSSLDDRIKATVVSGYTNTFKASIMARRHCLDNYIPGVLEYAEMPELIALNAPKPLFIEAGKKDHLFPIAAVEEAVEKIKKIYAVFEAEDAVQTHYFDGGHEICGEPSIDWLIEQLKK